MRSAPSVSFPVGRCAIEARLLAAMALLGLASGVAAWSWLSGLWGLLIVAGWCVWSILALARVRRGPVGRLVFRASQGRADAAAQAWAWEDLAGSGLPIDGPVVVIDLQRALLLRLGGPADVPRWLWVEHRSAPHDWLALRRALRWQAAQAPVDQGPSGIVRRA